MADPRFRSWPITEVGAIEAQLRDMGLKVAAAEIDGTSGKGGCLSDALVSVGPAGHGGTGSFVSADGLIITNHHVAFDAVRQASTVENDYLHHGFVARSLKEELAGPDYEVWITRSCEDVSEAILEASRSEADPLARANKVRDRKQELAKGREAALPEGGGVRCEVQEMWPDKQYVLFTYERLKDVRIVYVPPMSLGNFGGDTDNFEWPRHTADFTLLRAYVGPDGRPTDAAPENVPYKPSRHLRVCRDGFKEKDFAFLLGFPGHTMRYAPGCRLRFDAEVAVPSLVKDFGFKLDLIAKFSDEREVVLKLDSTRKSLSNEFKRQSGKRIVASKLGLLQERLAEEAELVRAAPEAAAVLQRLGAIYDELRDEEPRSEQCHKIQGLYAGSALMFAAHTLYEATVESAKPDSDREASFRERNRPFLVKRLFKRLKDMHPAHEALLVDDVLENVPEAWRGAGPAATSKLVQESALLGLSQEDVEAIFAGGSGLPESDFFVTVAKAAHADFVANRDKTKALLSERDQLLAKLLEMQKAHSKDTFYPDANGTLRLSAGHVEGYEAADAVRFTPFTTLAGIKDKHFEAHAVSVKMGTSGRDEFELPPRLAEMFEQGTATLTTPVCCCYSTDTVGGNSGSPVLNANGEFCAINFDRQRLGLMNEFKWSSKFSRSIGVDVRYILWLVGTYDGATHLVEEMTR